MGEMPTRLRRIAAATAATAPSCPIRGLFRRSSRCDRRSNSCSWMRLAGIFVHSSMTRARFSTVSAGTGTASSLLLVSRRSSWVRRCGQALVRLLARVRQHDLPFLCKIRELLFHRSPAREAYVLEVHVEQARR
jgi:hypothetical protein